MSSPQVQSLAEQTQNDVYLGEQAAPSMHDWLAPEPQITAGQRIMWDSVNPAAIKALLARTNASEQPELIAGYPDYGWSHDDFRYFRDKGFQTVGISQRDPGDPRLCSVGDLEPGAMTKLGLRQFMVARDGFRPETATSYASIDNYPNVGQALTGLHYWAWVAWWPNYPSPSEISQIKAQLPAGATLAAIQYFNDQVDDVDLSLVLDPAWHRAA